MVLPWHLFSQNLYAHWQNCFWITRCCALTLILLNCMLMATKCVSVFWVLLKECLSVIMQSSETCNRHHDHVMCCTVWSVLCSFLTNPCTTSNKYYHYYYCCYQLYQLRHWKATQKDKPRETWPIRQIAKWNRTSLVKGICWLHFDVTILSQKKGIY